MKETIRVLLVDDEESFWRPMSERLAARELEVDVAACGPEALEHARSCGGDYHVAVIDQVMGPPNGIETMRELRRAYPGIEVIILTGWGDMTPGPAAMEMGAYRYMSKPISNADELVLNIQMAARFGRERQRRLASQALVRAGQRINMAGSEEALYQQLYDEVRELLPALDGFLVTRHDPYSQVVSFPFSVVRGQRLCLPHRQDGNGIAEFVLRRREPLLLSGGDRPFRQQHRLHEPDPEIGYCASKLVVPMFPEGHAVETLNAFTYEESVRYTQEHLNVLQAFGNQVAVAMRNLWQLEEARQLRDATAALAAQRGTEAVLRSIVAEGHELIDSDFTGLILQDPDGTLRKVRPVLPEEAFDRFGEPRQRGGITRAVVESRQPVVVADTRQDARVKDSVREAGVRSMLVMPLIRGEQVLGVLYAHTYDQRFFSHHDLDLWSAFATQAAVVLHSAMEEEQEVEGARTLAAELGILAEKLALEETLVRVASAAKAVFGSDTCRLAYVDPATGRVISWTWARDDPEHYRAEPEARAGGLTRRVLDLREPVYCPDATLRAGPSPHPALVARGLRSMASVPLVYGGRVIGVLHCHYYRSRQRFSEHLKALGEAFRARAAMALDRARRDHASEIWRELDGHLTASRSSRKLYWLLASQALQALHADFAVFYPYATLVTPGRRASPLVNAIRVGNLWATWQPPTGGLGGGVHEELDNKPDGLIIENDLDPDGKRFQSRLARREGVRAFIALRLDLAPEGQTEAQRAGYLFLNYRQPTAFEDVDLVELQLAGSRVAGAVQQLHMLAAEQRLRRQLNRRLRAVVSIFQAYRESRDIKWILERIAAAARDALDLDVCTLLEYDAARGRFYRRGAAGQAHPRTEYTLDAEWRDRFLARSRPVVVRDVEQDAWMRQSEFVRREGIKSVVVQPLRVDDQMLGLFFASYRQPRDPTPDELEAIVLLADLAALLLHESRLQEALSEKDRRLERRALLASASMAETTWRHSQINKASAIRNHTAALLKRLEKIDAPPPAMKAVPETVHEIDRLAAQIAAAPPRVPQPWEMEDELVPLASLLQEVAQREGTGSLMRTEPGVQIQADVRALHGVQVRANRRWLIYALETLIENARQAMPDGGRVLISGRCRDLWAEVRVRDSGTGVPEAVRGLLFREAIPKEHDQAGMGIGSLLVATIIEEHRGAIELEWPGPGDTTVCIRLPVAGEEREEEVL